MNYEMIMRYTDLDENAPDFPFGQKKVDARYWILEKKFSKIDDNKIYNLDQNWVFDSSKSTVSNGNEAFVLTKKESIFLKLLITKKR